jgi:hypothetical protein
VLRKLAECYLEKGEVARAEALEKKLADLPEAGK